MKIKNTHYYLLWAFLISKILIAGDWVQVIDELNFINKQFTDWPKVNEVKKGDLFIFEGEYYWVKSKYWNDFICSEPCVNITNFALGKIAPGSQEDDKCLGNDFTYNNVITIEDNSEPIHIQSTEGSASIEGTIYILGIGKNSTREFIPAQREDLPDPPNFSSVRYDHSNDLELFTNKVPADV